MRRLTIYNLGFKSRLAMAALFLNLYSLFLNPAIVSARITPEDIVNSRLEAFNSQAGAYSEAHRQRLTKISGRIAEINQRRTDQLSWIMESQARILDEYLRRQGVEDEDIKKSRYWITYAHEAVAYQRAKIYIFDLNGEGNIDRDTNNLVGLFRSDLNSTRDKVINSQGILKTVVSGN